jgi:RNA polymerase-binding protein DksA
MGKHENGRERAETLRKMLEDRRIEVVEKRRELREDLANQERANINEDEGADQFARGLDFALTEMKSQQLERIKDALGRLDKGTYGLCTECGEPIAAARLRALPFAECCRDCQERRET